MGSRFPILSSAHHHTHENEQDGCAELAVARCAAHLCLRPARRGSEVVSTARSSKASVCVCGRGVLKPATSSSAAPPSPLERRLRTPFDSSKLDSARRELSRARPPTDAWRPRSPARAHQTTLGQSQWTSPQAFVAAVTRTPRRARCAVRLRGPFPVGEINVSSIATARKHCPAESTQHPAPAAERHTGGRATLAALVPRLEPRRRPSAAARTAGR